MAAGNGNQGYQKWVCNCQFTSDSILAFDFVLFYIVCLRLLNFMEALVLLNYLDYEIIL